MLSRRLFVVFTLFLLACGDPTSLGDQLRGLILFSKGFGRETELFVIRSDGTGQRQVTHNDHWDSQPHWSPDGSQIVFISERDSVPGDPLLKPQVFVMNTDGSNLRKLTNEAGRPNTPRWSPDGTRITFHQRGPRGLQQIHVMNADGSQVRALTDGEFADFSAEWSPDGTKILFGSNRVTLDTSGPHGSMYGYPVWSPDGRQIAFTGGAAAWDVYVISSAGGPTSRLTMDAPSDFVFDWRRQ